MRAFVAIFPPVAIRAAAVAGARGAVLPPDRIRWSRPENVHLTLKFLGDGVREEDLASLSVILKALCARHEPFDVRLAGLGAFPSVRRASIVWAGVGEGSERLVSLAGDLDAGLSALGFQREGRPFAPHLTVGRVKGRPARIELSPLDVPDLKFPAEKIKLVRSTLAPQGAVYETVGSFFLGGGPGASRRGGA